MGELLRPLGGGPSLQPSFAWARCVLEGHVSIPAARAGLPFLLKQVGLPVLLLSFGASQVAKLVLG